MKEVANHPMTPETEGATVVEVARCPCGSEELAVEQRSQTDEALGHRCGLGEGRLVCADS